MTIDPKFNKYIENAKNIRTIQKDLIKKAEAVLIPRIDNSNVDKSIGLIHVTIVKCLRQIADNRCLYDGSRKQATVMHQEFSLIQKNQLSSHMDNKSLDAHQLIHSKVDKSELMEMYLKSQKTEMEAKLNKYKRGTSMIDMKGGRKGIAQKKQVEEIKLDQLQMMQEQIEVK